MTSRMVSFLDGDDSDEDAHEIATKVEECGPIVVRTRCPSIDRPEVPTPAPSKQLTLVQPLPQLTHSIHRPA